MKSKLLCCLMQVGKLYANCDAFAFTESTSYATDAIAQAGAAPPVATTCCKRRPAHCLHLQCRVESSLFVRPSRLAPPAYRPPQSRLIRDPLTPLKCISYPLTALPSQQVSADPTNNERTTDPRASYRGACTLSMLDT